jgi:hypothetical protein
MLVSSFEERVRRQETKQRLLLGFFSDEVWSSAYNTSLELRCSLSAAYKTLNQYESKGMLQSFLIEELNLKIWGITQTGLFASINHTKFINRRVFQPSKVNFLFVRHHLDLQIIMINAKRAGFTDWINGKRLPKLIQQRPDAVVTDNEGALVAVEYERTVKSYKRYEVIFSKYLQAIKRNEYSYVQYVCPDEVFAHRLTKLFATITSVPVAMQRVTLNEKHRSKIRVSSITSWPN